MYFYVIGIGLGTRLYGISPVIGCMCTELRIVATCAGTIQLPGAPEPEFLTLGA